VSREPWEWVQGRTGQELSPLARQVCTVLVEMGYGGIYNRPIAWHRQDWTNPRCIEINWKGAISNWDYSEMTALWGWSAELMLRVEIAPASPNTIKLLFWQRANLPTAKGQLDSVGLPPANRFQRFIYRINRIKSKQRRGR